MWIFTSFGVLMPSERPAHTIPEGDDRVIQIRTRRESELMWLKALYFKDMGEIVFYPHTDYEYRTYCTRDKLAEVLGAMARDIDYTKFKPTTETFGEKALHEAYNRIWGILYDMFSTNRYMEKGWTKYRQPRRKAQARR